MRQRIGVGLLILVAIATVTVHALWRPLITIAASSSGVPTNPVGGPAAATYRWIDLDWWIVPTLLMLTVLAATMVGLPAKRTRAER